MRVLALLRQGRGGMWNSASNLRDELASRGVEMDLLDASEFIPNETGPKVDRAVSEWLRNQGREFDLVHAWGYRSAWACAAAYGDREAWVYTAYDMPKSTHRLVINHLNDSQAGICASRGVFRVLDECLASHLEIVHPGVRVPEEPLDRTAARNSLGLPEEAFLVGAMGRMEPERGFESLAAAMESVWERRPDALLVVAGEGSARADWKERAARNPERIRLMGWLEDVSAFQGALDVLAVPSLRAGYSLTAVEAMALGVPVLLRDTGGLRELADPDVSGFLVKDDAEMASLLAELTDLPLTLESVGHGARIRAADHFGIERTAERVYDLYERVLEG